MSIQHIIAPLNENLSNLFVGDIVCKSITSVVPPAFVNITCNTLNSNSIINSGNIATSTATANTLSANNVIATSLATLDSVRIGTGNTPGRALTQQNGNIQTFEVPSSAYLVNQGQKLITNTLASTTILRSSIAPTIGTTYNSSIAEGDQFRLCAQGLYETTGACDFTFASSLYGSTIMSVMLMPILGLVPTSFWSLDITYTIVAITGTQVVVSQSGGLSTQNLASSPFLNMYSTNAQTAYIDPTPLVPDPVLTLSMSTLTGFCIAHTASFQRVFRY
jgi:hypothetical protein